MSDILYVIDATIRCQQCGRQLGGSPSDDFCSEGCQRAYHAARVDFDVPRLYVLLQPMVAHFAQLGEALQAAMVDLSERWSKTIAGLREAGLIPDQPPSDPMARALHLRRHRNTGPQRRQRPPRTIGRPHTAR